MSKSATLTSWSGTPQVQIVRSDPLPKWEEVPPEQRREPVLLLATLLLKRLAGRTASEEAARDE